MKPAPPVMRILRSFNDMKGEIGYGYLEVWEEKHLYHRFFAHYMSDSSETIVIAGSPRSGTTLLLDVLASSLRYRKIFEPLHPKAVPEAEKFYYRYLRPEEKDPSLESFMRRVLTGKTSNTWINNMGEVKDVKSFLKATLRLYRWRWWAPNRVIKIIRGNLMLAWLERNFGCKIIFIMRHPCAVVESQKRMG